MRNVAEKHNIGITQLFEAFQKAVDFNLLCSMTDANGTIIYANDLFCQISKYSREELTGQNHRIVNSGYHSKDFFKQMWVTISSRNTWRGEVKSKAKDGTYFWLDTIIVPILDDKGEIGQYFSLRMPINERKELEELNERRIKSMEQVLFQISHEVRQPVTQILAMVSLFEQGDLSEQELKKSIEHLKGAAQLLDRFTRNLTEFVTSEKKKVEGIGNMKRTQ